MTSTIALTNPWLLLGLLLIPAFYFLFRVTAPSPRRIAFPAIRLLRGLEQRESSRAEIPPWLVALRLLVIALIVIGLAGPVLNPPVLPDTRGPLIFLIDNGWASAPDWDARIRRATALIREADRQQRDVILLPTAPERNTGRRESVTAERPAAALDRLRDLEPRPWQVDRTQWFDLLESRTLDPRSAVIWLSDGLDYGDARRLETRLLRFSAVEMLEPAMRDIAPVIESVGFSADQISLRLARAHKAGRTAFWIRAVANDGSILARHEVVFPDGQSITGVEFALPLELRNRIGRIEIENTGGAAAVWLADSSRHRAAAIILTPQGEEETQPLLDATYYLRRALAGSAEVKGTGLGDGIEDSAGLIFVPDRGRFSEREKSALGRWTRNGGVLVRFAGERLAATAADELLTAPLRRGGRAMGGALSWDQPATLAPFTQDSPFHGLQIPADVIVRRQVLTEPGNNEALVWARLEDGTPLVTARAAEKGWFVLFHVSARPDWSSLPLSGLFVKMLDRLAALSRQGPADIANGAVLNPVSVLDGFGRLQDNFPPVEPVDAADIDEIPLGPETPPGLYGSTGNTTALNLAGRDGGVTGAAALKPIAELNGVIERSSYAAALRLDLTLWFLLTGFFLWIGDYAASLWLHGVRPAGRRRRRTPHSAAIVLCVILIAAAGSARADDDFAQSAVNELRFGYVETANPQINRSVRLGLTRLGEALAARSSVMTGAPMALNIETDPLILFPLVYWSVSPDDYYPTEKGLDNIARYLNSGGILLLDTADRPRAQNWLRGLLQQLDIPPLAPVPGDHVLRRSFYLIEEFPGRVSGKTVWVEKEIDEGAENVSAIIIGDNDWAAAWASTNIDAMPSLMNIAGQREISLRFGINLAMYALTGNYKADQVHLPAIMERLGQ